MTLKERVLEVLKNKGPLTLQQLYHAFPEHSRPSIRGTVYKLLYRGAVRRDGKGRYAFAAEDTRRLGREPKSGRPSEPAEKPGTMHRARKGRETKPRRPLKPVENPRSDRLAKDMHKAREAVSAEAALADALCRFAEGFGLALAASGKTCQKHGSRCRTKASRPRRDKESPH